MTGMVVSRKKTAFIPLGGTVIQESGFVLMTVGSAVIVHDDDALSNEMRL